MSDYKWFQRITWTDADQTDFWNRWKRCRTAGTKAQALRIQSLYLSERYPEESLRMLDKMLADFPDSLEIALAHWHRGEILLREGRIDAAIDALEKAFARELETNMKTNAWSTYGLVVVKHKLIDRYDQAEKQASARLARAVFPAERYYGHAILAIIEQYRGNLKAAIEHARCALAEVKVEHSGFTRHPDIGLVNNPDKELIADLKEMALV